MLFLLAQNFTDYISWFNLFNYLTLRAVVAVLLALSFSLFFGNFFIDKLKKLQVSQSIREDGPKSHLQKSGTPTMGGVLILISILLSVILCADLSNKYVLIMIYTIISFGLIGFYDDYKKVVLKNSAGLSALLKYSCLSFNTLLIVSYIYFSADNTNETILVVPFFKEFMPDLGLFYLIFSYFVVVGTSNAVNLTDGLDGLAIVPIVMVATGFALVAYLVGNINFSHYLNIPFIPNAGELIVVCAAIVGAGVGFLWFNTYPALVFMGDVGSLSLGATLGVIAILVRQEFLLVIMGGIFVIEALSVILQVSSFKLRAGKRIFKMAPIHHHFELMGTPEPRVIVRFWIVTLVLVLVGLLTLKIR